MATTANAPQSLTRLAGHHPQKQRLQPQPAGANTQAVLMSIDRTLKQRGHDPLQTMTQSLATYLTTYELPTTNRDPHPCGFAYATPRHGGDYPK